jgi:hypothetical protein
MQWSLLARTATRWWSAPARVPAHRNATTRDTEIQQHAGVWLYQTPVGIRTQA